MEDLSEEQGRAVASEMRAVREGVELNERLEGRRTAGGVMREMVRDAHPGVTEDLCLMLEDSWAEYHRRQTEQEAQGQAWSTPVGPDGQVMRPEGGATPTMGAFGPGRADGRGLVSHRGGLAKETRAATPGSTSAGPALEVVTSATSPAVEPRRFDALA
jgi:hypothetical protein